MSNPPELMTMDEACEYLEISRQSMHKWIKKGRISGRKYANRWFFKRIDLDAALPQDIREKRRHA